MAGVVSCPECGEQEDLRGERRSDDAVDVTCEACGHAWTRERLTCPSCADRGVYEEKRPLYQKARGVQQSIIGTYTVRTCPSCGWTDAAGEAREGWTSDDR